MGALSIPLEQVKETPRRFRLEAAGDWWERTRARLREPEAALARAFVIEFEGHRMGARLLFRGQLCGAIELECGRCLEPYTREFQEPVQILLEPVRASDPLPAEGITVDPEDLELGRYQGDVLDFEPVVSEILALAWPMHPVCSEACQGLCPMCGRNRSREKCSCEVGRGSQHWSALGKLLERMRGERD
jgi:uncharacterized protein